MIGITVATYRLYIYLYWKHIQTIVWLSHYISLCMGRRQFPHSHVYWRCPKCLDMTSRGPPPALHGGSPGVSRQMAGITSNHQLIATKWYNLSSKLPLWKGLVDLFKSQRFDAPAPCQSCLNRIWHGCVNSSGRLLAHTLAHPLPLSPSLALSLPLSLSLL